MRMHGNFGKLLLAVIIAVITHCSANYAGDQSNARFRAVCVGLRYPGTKDELEYTTNDVRQIAEAFKISSGFGESADVVTLVDDIPGGIKPTVEVIRQKLHAMAENAGAKDRLAFYFSGHGLNHRGKSILVCHSQDGRSDGAYLELSEVRDILSASRAESKLVVIDACHSGGKATANDQVTPDAIASALGGSGMKAAGEDSVAWLVSCGANEKSWEDDDSQQGLFTRFFLDAIGPMAPVADSNYDGVLSIAEVYEFIRTGVSHFLFEKRRDPQSVSWRTRRQTPRAGVGGSMVEPDNPEGLRRFKLLHYELKTSAPQVLPKRVPETKRTDPVAVVAQNQANTNQPNTNRINEWRERVIASVSPGTTYSGVWTRNNGAGEINLVFTKMSSQNVNVEGYLCDPVYPQEHARFTGSIFTDENSEFQVKLDVNMNTVKAKEIKSGSQETFVNRKLGNSSRYTLHLSLTDDGMRGRQGSPKRATIDFKRVR